MPISSVAQLPAAPGNEDRPREATLTVDGVTLCHGGVTMAERPGFAVAFVDDDLDGVLRRAKEPSARCGRQGALTKEVGL